MSSYGGPDDELSEYDLRAIRERRKLFIGGLSFKITDQQLGDIFSRYGRVEQAEIMKLRESGRSRGFGFVIYADSRDATDALNAMNGTDLMGRPVRVDFAQSKSESKANRGPPYGGSAPRDVRDVRDVRDTQGAPGGSRVGRYAPPSGISGTPAPMSQARQYEPPRSARYEPPSAATRAPNDRQTGEYRSYGPPPSSSMPGSGAGASARSYAPPHQALPPRGDDEGSGRYSRPYDDPPLQASDNRTYYQPSQSMGGVAAPPRSDTARRYDEPASDRYRPPANMPSGRDYGQQRPSERGYQPPRMGESSAPPPQSGGYRPASQPSAGNEPPAGYGGGSSYRDPGSSARGYAPPTADTMDRGYQSSYQPPPYSDATACASSLASFTLQAVLANEVPVDTNRTVRPARSQEPTRYSEPNTGSAGGYGYAPPPMQQQQQYQQPPPSQYGPPPGRGHTSYEPPRGAGGGGRQGYVPPSESAPGGYTGQRQAPRGY